MRYRKEKGGIPGFHSVGCGGRTNEFCCGYVKVIMSGGHINPLGSFTYRMKLWIWKYLPQKSTWDHPEKALE